MIPSFDGRHLNKIISNTQLILISVTMFKALDWQSFTERLLALQCSDWENISQQHIFFTLQKYPADFRPFSVINSSGFCYLSGFSAIQTFSLTFSADRQEPFRYDNGRTRLGLLSKADQVSLQVQKKQSHLFCAIYFMYFHVFRIIFCVWKNC